MDFPQENAVVSDESIDEDHGIFSLPLAAILCIVIVIYGLLVLICIFMRQVILNRRPLSTLESLHCCDCLLFLPRPAITPCGIPCGQVGKTDTSPCQLHFERLWSALPSVRCRLSESPPDSSSCWPPALPAAQCPTSVRCCGLEIRRDTRPGMVDASVSSGDVLKPPTLASRGIQHGAMLEPTDCSHYSGQQPASSMHYSQRCAVLVPGDSGRFSQHPTDSVQHPADSSPYSQHETALETADSGDYSQHGAMLDPAALLDTGSTSALSTAA